METRRMMSVTPAGDGFMSESTAPSALLLPAVQKVREAAARSPSISEITVTKPTDVASTGL